MAEVDVKKLRQIANNLSATFGVEDDEGVLSDKFLDALAHAEERGTTHNVRADPRFPNVSQVSRPRCPALQCARQLATAVPAAPFLRARALRVLRATAPRTGC